ncbi:MAG: hypothetical protein RLZZ630_1585 [Bacteroidota bacterium]|jgi:hypothetical protein
MNKLKSVSFASDRIPGGLFMDLIEKKPALRGRFLVIQGQVFRVQTPVPPMKELSSYTLESNRNKGNNRW